MDLTPAVSGWSLWFGSRAAELNCVWGWRRTIEGCCGETALQPALGKLLPKCITDYTTFEVLSPKKHRSWFTPWGRVKHVTIITSLTYWQLTSRLILHCYCHLVRDAQGGRPECCCCVPGFMTCKWKESARLLSLDIFPTDSKQTTHLLTYWLPLGNISISIRELPSLHYIWFTLCEMTDWPSGYKTTHFLTLVFNHFLANITVGHLLYQMS